MPNAYVVLPSGEVTVKSLKGLEQYQQMVGGMIQFIPFPTVRKTATGETKRIQLSCYVNEEGKMQGLPMNKRATELVASVLFQDDFIVGPMIITGIDTETGEDVDCPADVKEFIFDDEPSGS